MRQRDGMARAADAGAIRADQPPPEQRRKAQGRNHEIITRFRGRQLLAFWTYDHFEMRKSDAITRICRPVIGANSGHLESAYSSRTEELNLGRSFEGQAYEEPR